MIYETKDLNKQRTPFFIITSFKLNSVSTRSKKQNNKPENKRPKQATNSFYLISLVVLAVLYDKKRLYINF